MISSSAPRAQAGGSTPGDVIADRYRIERLLGEGGMGAVFVVLDMATERRVALKRLHATTTNASALFEREYQILAGLKHPGIVEVYDYGSDADGAFYTMELVEGDDLAKRAPLPWRAVCGLLRDVASILGVLHARGLTHRDLSPRNLMLRASGDLKLIDFGALAPFGPSPDVVGTSECTGCTSRYGPRARAPTHSWQVWYSASKTLNSACPTR